MASSPMSSSMPRGSHKSMSQALIIAPFAGRLVYVGITPEAVSSPCAAPARRELTLLASRNALAPDFTRIIKFDRGRQE